MPFLSQLKAEIHLYEGWQHQVLQYLLTHAIGRSNAVTWDDLRRNLNLTFNPDVDPDKQHYINRTRFSFDLIAKSRENGIFICSSDQNPKGFWIAQCMADVIDMREFYRKGIDALSKNLNALDQFVTEEFGGEKKEEPIELKYIKEREGLICCIVKNCSNYNVSKQQRCSGYVSNCEKYLPLFNKI